MAHKIFIDGEHGTTGLQIRTRLASRNDLESLSIPHSERHNKNIREDFLNQADVAILCLPDDASREAVSMLSSSNTTRVIDTSTAFRTHPDWAYGFAELEHAQAQKICAARFVSNPGCYPTGAVSLIRPLRMAGLMSVDHPFSVNAISGYTGGGKQLIAQMEDTSREDHVASPHFLYGLSLNHKHVPEMKIHGLLNKAPLFAPSVGKFPQGMIVQVPLHLDNLIGEQTPQTIHKALSDHYRGQNIVQVVSQDETAQLSKLDPTELKDQDTMKLFVFSNAETGVVNLVAILDNLGKGASGAAVQNLDLMLSAS